MNDLTFDHISDISKLVFEKFLPDTLVESINNYIDSLSPEEDAKWKKYNLLQRDISNIFLTKEHSEEIGLSNYLEILGDLYLEINGKVRNRKCKVRVAPDLPKKSYLDIWVNRYYASDYSCSHTHAGGLSGVIFLKLSEKLTTQSNERSDGKLQFFVPSGNGLDVLNCFPIQEVGKVLIFPSNLCHAVYPQKDNEERRTLSFNLNIL